MVVPELEQAEYRFLPVTRRRAYEGLDGVPYFGKNARRYGREIVSVRLFGQIYAGSLSEFIDIHSVKGGII